MQVLSVTELILLLVLSLDFSKAVYVFERAVRDLSQNNEKNIEAYRGAVDYSYVIKIGSTMQYLPQIQVGKLRITATIPVALLFLLLPKLRGKKEKKN